MTDIKYINDCDIKREIDIQNKTVFELIYKIKGKKWTSFKAGMIIYVNSHRNWDVHIYIS